MKIDFYISSLSGGGAEKVLVMVAERLMKRGHNISIVSLEKREQVYYPEKGILLKKIQGNYKGIFSFFYNLVKIREHIHIRQADVSISFLLRCNLLLLIASVFSNRKVIVCERNNPKKEHSKVIFYITQVLYLRANRIIVQTEAIKQMYSKFLKKKVYVIENPIDDKGLLSQVNKHDKKHSLNRIIAMGRLEPQKDFETIIKAFAEISGNYPDWVLDIYGTGKNRDTLLNYISNMNMTNKVRLCGRTNRPFYEMYRSKIFVLSSFYEGFPNVLCEAMYAGLICIASNCISGPSELIEHEKNGYLFNIKDYIHLSELLSFSIDNYDKLEFIRRNAKKSVLRLKVDKNILCWEKHIFEVSNGN